MNLMILQRYKNEFILLAALFFALFAFLYKVSANSYVKDNKENIHQKIMEINNISVLKEQWGGKQLANKVKILKTIVPNSKVSVFKKKAKKLTALYNNLTGSELSKLTNKLINIPVQIELLNIKKSAKNQYTMELTCKW